MSAMFECLSYTYQRGYSAQERTPTQVPSDEDDEEMTYDRRRFIRRIRKGERPSTAQGLWVKRFKG
jgi:hypothetical protein